jgi:hypothetical protein
MKNCRHRKTASAALTEETASGALNEKLQAQKNCKCSSNR